MAIYLNGLVSVIQGDITEQTTDAIVNAANCSMMGGGGVDGAIHRVGGPDILRECKRLRSTRFPQGLPTGAAVATTAGRLKARYVIHTVGPVWQGGQQNEDSQLRDCYLNCLTLARDMELSSIAFPAISTGIYGFPILRSVELVSGLLQDFSSQKGTIQQIQLVFFSVEDYQIFLNNTSLTQES